MNSKRIGKYTVQFSQPPVITATAAIVGPKEGEGPLRDTFDLILEDTYWGEKSWELTERKMLAASVQMALDKSNLKPQDVQFLLAGDLLNQTISANYAARQFDIPFLGLYGACSTMFEGLALAAILIDGGFADHVIAAASSHYGTAERQYRFPTEHGNQRSMSAQWTVTGAAAIMVGASGQGPRITQATVGRVLDLGVKDAADMGSAMAPAIVLNLHSLYILKFFIRQQDFSSFPSYNLKLLQPDEQGLPRNLERVFQPDEIVAVKKVGNCAFADPFPDFDTSPG